jgi:predicted CopG family antitoxin
MKSITIHGVGEDVEKLIKKRAKTEARSVNKVVKGLIEESLGLGRRRKDNREDFADLFGVWSEEEAANFLEAIGDLEKIDKEDWR